MQKRASRKWLLGNKRQKWDISAQFCLLKRLKCLFSTNYTLCTHVTRHTGLPNGAGHCRKACDVLIILFNPIGGPNVTLEIWSLGIANTAALVAFEQLDGDETFVTVLDIWGIQLPLLRAAPASHSKTSMVESVNMCSMEHFETTTSWECTAHALSFIYSYTRTRQDALTRRSVANWCLEAFDQGTSHQSVLMTSNNSLFEATPFDTQTRTISSSRANLNLRSFWQPFTVARVDCTSKLWERTSFILHLSFIAIVAE